MLEEIRRAKKKTTKKIQNKSKRKKQTNKQSHLVIKVYLNLCVHQCLVSFFEKQHFYTDDLLG
jgi:hypothetical protein